MINDNQNNSSMQSTDTGDYSVKGNTISYETQQPDASAPFAEPAPDDMDSED